MIADKDDTNLHCETHSNFSSKVHEREYFGQRDKDDCSSMKSLNIAGEQKKHKNKEKPDRVLKEKEKQMYDNISVSSYKSHKSGLTAHRISV